MSCNGDVFICATEGRVFPITAGADKQGMLYQCARKIPKLFMTPGTWVRLLAVELKKQTRGNIEKQQQRKFDIHPTPTPPKKKTEKEMPNVVVYLR